MTLQSTSIRRKVMTVIMLASITVLLVTVAAFMIYDWVTFRQTMVDNLATQARIIAANSTAALAYENENDASNLLASLRIEPHITAAALYDVNGKLFASYPAQITAADLPARPQRSGHRFAHSHLVLFQPVIQSGSPLGTLYLQSNLTALTQRLQLYVAISLLIILGSMLVVFWLSTILQRRISEPVIGLAETAQKISARRDYSLRAVKRSEDELGLLTDSFNNMLERIQSSDSALRASEAQFRLVTDQAPVLLEHVNNESRYKFVNRPFAEFYGRKPEEIIGKHAVEIVGMESFRRVRPHVVKVLEGQPAQFELELANSKGERRWHHVEYTPEKNSGGEVVGFVAVYTDITDRKRVEMEIESARDKALAASRAKDDFLAALSHELRTPLNPVLLVASDAALNPELSADLRACFDMIRRNVELEARLIDDLLDLTRITRGKLSLEKQPLDVRTILNETLAIVRADADKKRIQLICDFESAPQMILGDAVRLQQIFWNILKNAVKFTPEAGEIKMVSRTLLKAGKVCVEITDTGVGLTSEEILHIFDAFAQGEHAGSHRFGGLGLGLTISRKLVELHSATISAASSGRDLGATFTVEFPLLSDRNPTDAAAKIDFPAPRQSKTVERHPGGRILLVEDHEPTRNALTHLLSRRDYQVFAASTLAEARALARQEHFDLVVSDIGLPDGDGYTLMSELRDAFGLKGIALSGYGMEQDLARGKAAGFVTHLIKPVRVESLEKALSDAG
jgi:PAS domain S-box-containing protein